MADILVGWGAIMIVIGVLFLAATAFWLWMLVDCLTNEQDPNQKLLWFLVIFFLHFLGALIYFIARRSGRAQSTGTTL